MGIDRSRTGIVIGQMEAGPRNSIADVPGVRVGHCTLDADSIQTGVSAILPHSGNLFRSKVVAASHVLNGFGKSIGLVQIDELGSLETPILLTNTLSVGSCAETLVRFMLDEDPEIGRGTGTVNPVVCECNDGWLNDIRGLHVGAAHVREALASASADFEEGAVGAGRGMRCFGLKGGIGSASRILHIEGYAYALGALLLTNFGSLERLTIAGDPVGLRLAQTMHEEDRGSVIVVLATDAPFDARQLGRLCRRAGVGLARVGSYIGHGSGDIALAFSTSNQIEHECSRLHRQVSALHEGAMEEAFRAVAEAVEEAVLSSMLHAVTTTGRDGHCARSLAELLDSIEGSRA